MFQPTIQWFSSNESGGEMSDIETVLSRLDAFGKSVGDRLDAMSARLDSVEQRGNEGENLRADVKHFSKRKDDDDDDTFKKRLDAEEESLREKLEEEGCSKEDAAKRAKRARKDVETRMRADHNPEDWTSAPGVGSRTDNDDSSLRAKLASAQMRADSVAQAFGEHAPRPMSGELLHEYRTRIAKLWQRHSKEFKNVDLNKIPAGAAFDGIEQTIYADARVASMAEMQNPG